MSCHPFRLGVPIADIDIADAKEKEMKTQPSFNTSVEEFLDPRGLHNIKSIVKQVLFEAGVFKDNEIKTAGSLPLISAILPAGDKE